MQIPPIIVRILVCVIWYTIIVIQMHCRTQEFSHTHAIFCLTESQIDVWHVGYGYDDDDDDDADGEQTNGKK